MLTKRSVVRILFEEPNSFPTTICRPAIYAAIRGCSVKVLQRERCLNIGCPFRRINGTTVRYKFGDIMAFLESQPAGGGAVKPNHQPRRGPGRPRRSSP